MFKNKGKLKMHIRKHYWVNEAEQNCTCNMEFRGRQAMMEHYKIVHLNFERCLKCDSVVKDADERIHTCKNKLPKVFFSPWITLCSLFGNISVADLASCEIVPTVHSSKMA